MAKKHNKYDKYSCHYAIFKAKSIFKLKAFYEKTIFIKYSI